MFRYFALSKYHVPDMVFANAKKELYHTNIYNQLLK